MKILNNAKNIIKDLKKSYNNNYKILLSIISSFMLLFLIRSILALLDTLFAIEEYPIQRILFMVSSTFLIIGLEIGFTKLIFNALDLKKISMTNIFDYFHLLVKYIQGMLCFYGIILLSSMPALCFLYYKSNGDFLSIIYSSMDDPYFQEMVLSYFDLQTVIVVVLLLLLPMIYVSIRLFMWSYYVIDKEINGYLAIKKSIALTENRASEIIFYLFGVGLFNVLGLLTIVGICFTIPITYIFLCKYYRLIIMQESLTKTNQ